MVARDKEAAAAQLRRQWERFGDWPEREIAEVQNDIVGADGLDPSAGQLGILLVDCCERTARELDDARMAEV